MLCVIKLNVIMPSVIMRSVIKLNVICAEFHHAKCHYAQCHQAECRGAVKIGKKTDSVKLRMFPIYVWMNFSGGYIEQAEVEEIQL